ncbi:MAG: hypothetical protein LBT82_01045 [Oscillospiraceae bacterium]|nr:hypothetical protein [Oscillospiraceae bacterium]
MNKFIKKFCSFFLSLCILFGVNNEKHLSHAFGKKNLRNVKTVKNSDSANWCWMSVAQGLMSQVLDPVPEQTNMFLNLMQFSKQDVVTIKRNSEKGSSKNIKEAINKYMDHHFQSYSKNEAIEAIDESAINVELYHKKSHNTKAPGVNRVKGFFNEHGPISYRTGEKDNGHFVLITGFFEDEKNNEYVEFMDTNGIGRVSQNFENFFKDIVNSSVCFLNVNIEKLELLWKDPPIFKAKNTCGFPILVYSENNKNKNAVHEIQPGVEFDVFSISENEEKCYLTNPPEMYVESKLVTPLDCEGKEISIFKNIAEIPLHDFNDLSKAWILKGKTHLTVRGFGPDYFTTDFFGNHTKLVVFHKKIAQNDAGESNLNFFVHMLNSKSFCRVKADGSKSNFYKSTLDFPVPVFLKNQSEPVLFLGNGIAINVFLKSKECLFNFIIFPSQKGYLPLLCIPGGFLAPINENSEITVHLKCNNFNFTITEENFELNSSGYIDLKESNISAENVDRVTVRGCFGNYIVTDLYGDLSKAIFIYKDQIRDDDVENLKKYYLN